MLRALLNQWVKVRQGIGDSRDTSIARAQVLRRQGNIAAARELCMEILRGGADDADVLALLIGMAADERQIEVGLQWAQRAFDTDPRSVSANYALGQLWEAAEQHAHAEACYRRVTELDPQHARAHNNLGCMLHIQGRLDEALTSYRQALQLEPDQPEALRNAVWNSWINWIGRLPKSEVRLYSLDL